MLKIISSIISTSIIFLSVGFLSYKFLIKYFNYEFVMCNDVPLIIFPMLYIAFPLSLYIINYINNY